MGIFTAAAIQMRSGTEPKRNAADFEALVRKAAGKGATYVQTPEMTGAIVRDSLIWPGGEVAAGDARRLRPLRRSRRAHGPGRLRGGSAGGRTA